MKKALKITGITLAVLTVLTVILCLFTGIVPYLLVKSMDTDSDISCSEWPHYDAGMLSSAKMISYNGVCANVPSDMENAVDKNGNVRQNVFSNKKTAADGQAVTLIIMDRNTERVGSLSDMFSQALDGSGSDMSATQRRRAEKMMAGFEKAFNEYCESIGKKPPANRYEYMEVIYSSDLKSVNVFDRDRTVVRAVLAVMRSTLAVSLNGEVMFFENETTKAFVSPYGENGGKYLVELFDRNDLDASYILIVSAPDEDVMYKIINSLRIE